MKIIIERYETINDLPFIFVHEYKYFPSYVKDFDCNYLKTFHTLAMTKYKEHIVNSPQRLRDEVWKGIKEELQKVFDKLDFTIDCEFTCTAEYIFIAMEYGLQVKVYNGVTTFMYYNLRITRV